VNQTGTRQKTSRPASTYPLRFRKITPIKRAEVENTKGNVGAHPNRKIKMHPRTNASKEKIRESKFIV
jgi:hypothetical protein